MFQGIVYVEAILKFWLVRTFPNKSHTTIDIENIPQQKEASWNHITHKNKRRKKKGKKTQFWINVFIYVQLIHPKIIIIIQFDNIKTQKILGPSHVI